jgi:hypothetical protein
VKAGVGLTLAWSFWLWGVDWILARLFWLNEAARSMRWLSGMHGTATQDAVADSCRILGTNLLPPLIFALTLAVPVAMLVRTLARARLRTRLSDPLDGVRAWTTAHPKATRSVLAVPALFWVGNLIRHAALYIHHWGGRSMYGDLAGNDVIRHLHLTYAASMGTLACVLLLPALGVHAATRWGLRAFLAPTLDPEEEKVGMAVEDRIVFDAVAVTTETRAAVAGMAALPFVTFFAAQAAHLGNGATEATLAMYVAVAMAGMLAFRRGSRIAVGADGVLVTGTSRTRFFAYHGLAVFRGKGSDVVLVRGSRIVLRFQLHGEDATQKEAMVARIQKGIDAAKELEKAATGQVITSVSEDQLLRLAPAVTREQLWSLVEGPEHDVRMQTAAARALAKTGDSDERARLRIAAGHCAQPEMRVTLMALAEEVDDEDLPVASGGAVRFARS